jgi:phosphonate transport system substrate-binding protein
VDVVVPEDYEQAIAALCEGRADGAWLSTPAYVLCHAQCGAEAAFKVERRGRADQVAQILVEADARRQAREVQPIRTLADLEDKSVAFVDPLSTTGYLIPKMLLLREDVALGQELFVGGNNQAILALYRGEVDAASTYWQPIRRDGSVGDARAELLDLYPDIVEATKILRLSEPIPNAPIVLRQDLSPSLRRELVAIFVALSTSEEAMDALREASGVTGFVPTSDAAYDVVREIGARLELDFAQIIAGIPY